MIIKRILSEPLLHFVLIGTVLFAAYNIYSDSVTEVPNEIKVTQDQINHFTTGFTRMWQRPPSAVELEELIRDYIREEIYYREALAMGLDQGDIIIRRRLRQKLEFISSDIADQRDPTDRELRAYYKNNVKAFRTDPRFTFRHIYFNPMHRGSNLKQDVNQVLEQLKQSGNSNDTEVLGDSFLLGYQFDAVTGSEVTKVFGENFKGKLNGLTISKWEGPIESGYGVHLVHVSERTESRVPKLEEVRDAVQRNWIESQRLQTNEKFYKTLLERYTVIIERPHITSLDHKFTLK